MSGGLVCFSGFYKSAKLMLPPSIHDGQSLLKLKIKRCITYDSSARDKHTLILETRLVISMDYK